jgi:hypothetical protein
MRTPRWFLRNRVLPNARVIAALILILSAAVMAFIAASPYAVAQPPTAPSTQAATAPLSPEELRLRKEWQEAISKVPLPKKGCFSASYPDKEWKEVPCGAPSKYPNPPASGPRPNIVGNGNDISPQVTGLISTAVGSFDSVTPANVTETGPWGGNPNTPNAFTLQINSQFFTTTVCAGHAGCLGWQQFIYSQNQCGGPCVFMEYWLINFGPVCPAGPWIQAGNSCWFNSANSPAPAVTAAQLQGTTLTANASGTTDSVVLTSPGGPATAMAADSVVNLSQSWNAAEWIICGDCCSGQANFSAGTTIVPRTRVISGSQNPPNCLAQGFTGETNNLSFGPNPPAPSQPGPALIFTESSAGGAPSFCAAATSVGDTHLTTLKGLFYDFQASGDFVLAEVDPDFVVQARQASGAPNWPNASVNKAVATRMGKTKVAICLPSTGNDSPAKLHVDGKATELDDGKTISTPDGVDISRRGNVYTITSHSGDSVRATAHPTWIDVALGLGCWPAKVRGLIANPNDNVNQIEARDGMVLTKAFSFEDLYHRYADSWRVAPRESLLSVCDGNEIERGIPTKPFYAKDLEPKVREKALAVCTAAGVKPGPLLDACTLDVAVIGNDDAAKVFVDMGDPVALGNVVSTSGEGGAECRVCWLLVAVLVVIAFILWMLLIRKRRTTP